MMVIHRNFESDCKRIAREIMWQLPHDDFEVYFNAEVAVSEKVVKFMYQIYQKNKRKFNLLLNNEINKHLSYCSATLERVSFNNFGRMPFFHFYVEIDDEDE